MIVNQPPRRGLERRCERSGRVGDIVVDWRVEVGGLITGEKRRNEEEQLGLPLTEVAHEPGDEPGIPLLLAHETGWRVLSGADEPRAITGTADLDQPFCAAAHRADLLTQGRTPSSGATRAAQRTQHVAQVYTGVRTICGA